MGQKINEYPNEAFSISSGDYFDMDKDMGGGVYQSNKISGGTILDQIAYATVKYNGSFYSKNTQTCVSGGIAAMEADSEFIVPNGVGILNDAFGKATLIQVSKNTNYNIQFSAQLNRTSGGSEKQITIWLRKNGTDLEWSATHLTVQANAGKVVAAWNFFVRIDVGDSVQIMWTQNDAIEILAENADLITPHPAVPSVIITVNEI